MKSGMVVRSRFFFSVIASEAKQSIEP